MPPTRRWKQLIFNSRSPLAWLFILGLICANLATFLVFWSLISRPGQASEPESGRDVLLQLPDPFLTPEPTPIATQVVFYVATATKTPTPLPTPTPTATSPPEPTPVVIPTEAPAQPKIDHVVIISIDGLRPDALFLARTPHLDQLIAGGAYSPDAQTVNPSVTLPGHASMLSGMTPEKHGIVWGLPYIGWPGMNGPTIFSVAHEAGLRTAMVFGKEKLGHLILPNSVDTVYSAEVHDEEIKAQAIKMIETGLPNVLFIHFPDTDRVGHEFGWMSDHQFEAITFVDGLIGQFIAALDSEGYRDRTLLIVTSDHGGHGFTHGDDSPLDRTIPWLAAGPGVPAGLTLTGPINTYDTAATALHALELPIPGHWDGRPVLEIFPE